MGWGGTSGQFDQMCRIGSSGCGHLEEQEVRFQLNCLPSNELSKASPFCHFAIEEAAPAGKRCPPWRRVDEWAAAQPASRWRKVVRGDGAKGPRVVRVAEALVQTKAERGRVGALERLVLVRSVDGEPRTWYALSNAPARVGLERVAWVQGQRHGVEESLEAGKGEVGLGHYEVRSWLGWHHHMTLSLLALWFLALEKQRLEKKSRR
jgi:hypothetical protein